MMIFVQHFMSLFNQINRALREKVMYNIIIAKINDRKLLNTDNAHNEIKSNRQLNGIYIMWLLQRGAPRMPLQPHQINK